MNAKQVLAVVLGWERYCGSLHQVSTESMAFDAGWDSGKVFAAPTRKAVTPAGVTVDVVDSRDGERFFASQTPKEKTALSRAWGAADFDDQENAFAAGWAGAEAFIRGSGKKKRK